jgi:hypothetical protein
VDSYQRAIRTSEKKSWHISAMILNFVVHVPTLLLRKTRHDYPGTVNRETSTKTHTHALYYLKPASLVEKYVFSLLERHECSNTS